MYADVPADDPGAEGYDLLVVRTVPGTIARIHGVMDDGDQDPVDAVRRILYSGIGRREMQARQEAQEAYVGRYGDDSDDDAAGEYVDTSSGDELPFD